MRHTSVGVTMVGGGRGGWEGCGVPAKGKVLYRWTAPATAPSTAALATVPSGLTGARLVRIHYYF